MFLRLLWESFARQRRRKLLAGIAILLGTTAVTAMLALALTIGDRIHNELAVYGANIVVYPRAEQLSVKIGGVDIKPATGGASLKESDLEKLHGIFWANNITGVSPELSLVGSVVSEGHRSDENPATGLWFDQTFGALKTGAPQLHPWWKVNGAWPRGEDQVALGAALARKMAVSRGGSIVFYPGGVRPAATPGKSYFVSGIVTTGDTAEQEVFLPLSEAQAIMGEPNFVSRVEISARTKPEDAFARRDPDTLSPAQHEIWYCRPYANSIAYQIQEVMSGSKAEQIRRVEQTEGTVLSRISGLMWLVSVAALLAAGFAVSAAMATAVLERRREIGLMRSLGASKPSIALLLYAESGLLALMTGTAGYLGGSLLAAWLGARIFPGDTPVPALNLVLLPVIVATAVVVALAGSTPSIRKALNQDPSSVLRADA